MKSCIRNDNGDRIGKAKGKAEWSFLVYPTVAQRIEEMGEQNLIRKKMKQTKSVSKTRFHLQVIPKVERLRQFGGCRERNQTTSDAAKDINVKDGDLVEDTAVQRDKHINRG
ncbi:hypothetical protein V6N13_110575 [Hibiscus sabdariffa]